MTLIYLDYNATTPLRDSVKKALVEILDEVGNPSSTHNHGRIVRKRLEAVRNLLAQIFGCHTYEVTFTSGATEANNQVLQGFDGAIIVSAIEHSSVKNVREDAFVCSVDANGVLDTGHLALLLEKINGPILVSVMLSNNEIGVVQPIEEVVTLVKKHPSCWVHCDVVQGLGKLNVDFKKLSADVYSLSAHKIGGPSGSGAMIHHEGFPMKALLKGGGQERSVRSGTQNILGIVGLGAALEESLKDDWKQVEGLRDRLEDEIQAYCPKVRVFGKNVTRLPNTSCLTMPGVKNDVQAINFDLANISISAGSACSSGTVKPSHVLLAMGVPEDEALLAVRVSLGWNTTEKEITTFIDQWISIHKKCSGEQK